MCESARSQCSTFCDHWTGNWLALLKSVGTRKCCWSALPGQWSHLKTHRHYSSCGCLAWVDINMFWWQKNSTGECQFSNDLDCHHNKLTCHISDNYPTTTKWTEGASECGGSSVIAQRPCCSVQSSDDKRQLVWLPFVTLLYWILCLLLSVLI